ncbi:MAG: TlpA disulfide reductase family protein [Gemmatimonadota bacterium]|jgi:thiol-disulfide isomerase/thioredoxin
MVTRPREHRLRPFLILGILVALAVLVWVAVPVPFVRGLTLGAVLSPSVLLAGILLLTRRLRRRMTGQLKPPPIPVVAWDFQMTAEDSDGNRVDFTRFSGNVLILNFWATWCAPCVAEMPSLSRLYEATSDLGVSLACVTREPVGTVRDFVSKRGIEVPFFVLDGEVPKCFESRAIPATFVLDKKGMIAFRHFGAAAWDHESVVDFVKSLASAPAF